MTEREDHPGEEGAASGGDAAEAPGEHASEGEGGRSTETVPDSGPAAPQAEAEGERAPDAAPEPAPGAESDSASAAESDPGPVPESDPGPEPALGSASVRGRAPRRKPLHGEDPYATPPYGRPGPWAPAPPVQHPTAGTPPHGTAVPSAGTTTPARGVPTPAGAGTPPHGGTSGVEVSESGSEPGSAPAPPAPAPRYDPWAPPSSAASGPTGLSGPPGDAGASPAAAGGLADGWSGRRGRARLAVGAVVLALVAGGAGAAVGAYAERHGAGEVRLPQAAPDDRGGGKDGGRAAGSIAGIAERALPGVVTLNGGGRGGEEDGTGTGFVLDKRGHILTNDHVVGAAAPGDSLRVMFHAGQSAEAEVVGRDSGYDLAVLKVSGVSGLRPLPLGNSDSVRVGDPVVAIGAPFELDGTVTSGIVSAKGRPIAAGGEGGGAASFVDALQTDAPINPGNSGGPLMDAKGRVVGVNSAIKAGSGADGPGGGAPGSIGLGFAIPVNQAKRVAEELINEGTATRPVIGVTLDTEYAGEGARVGNGGETEAVQPGSPADEAGLREGDVVTEVDGDRVRSAEELIVKVGSHRPDEEVRLKVRRDGEERTVRLTLEAARGG